MPPALPLLPPPPPRFPTRFDGGEDSATSATDASSWPGEGDEVETAPRGEGTGGGEVVWQLKTQGEEHVERLESKLEQLRAQPLPALADSEGAAALVPPLEEDTLEDALESDALSALSEVEEDAQAVGEEEEEGQALLSFVDEPGAIDQPRGRATSPSTRRRSLSADEEADASDNDGSPSRARLPTRLPPNAAPRNTAQRISFSNSVRIGGRGSHRSHRHHQHHHLQDAFLPAQIPPNERTSLLGPQSRPISAPSPFLVASVTASSSPSRSISPGPSSRNRRPSLPSSHRSSSANFAHLHAASVYSTSPASYGASRSSSPCSSIYAPLQPSSKHTPNPLFVRPAGALRGPRRSRSNSVLSFQEYLRSGGRVPFDLEADSDEEDLFGEGAEEDEPRAEYHDLVEQHRLRKSRWEARRRAKEARRRGRDQAARAGEGGGFWDRLAALLALGVAGSSSGRGAPTAVSVLVAPPSPASVRGSSRPSPLWRPPSHDSFSSSDGEAILPRHPSGRASLSSSRPPHPTDRPPAKSEDDVRFGPAPGRYFRWSWIKFQLERVIRAAKRMWATALLGWEKARERDRRVLVRQREEGGYEEV
ncbi:hypothetical protein JCM10213_003025 [Rhodosporidiobolus nylandii]